MRKFHSLGEKRVAVTIIEERVAAARSLPGNQRADALRLRALAKAYGSIGCFVEAR